MITWVLNYYLPHIKSCLKSSLKDNSWVLNRIFNINFSNFDSSNFKLKP